MFGSADAAGSRADECRAALAAAAAAASPAPWTCREDGATWRVQAGATVVEQGLPMPFALYLAALRNGADAVLNARPSRSATTRLRQAVGTAMDEVGAQWVFVAPTDVEGRYFLHDCVRKVGGGGLVQADALFLDAAKALLPRLLGQAEAAGIGRSGRRVLIPRRRDAEDVAEEYGRFADADLPLHALSGRNALPERTNAMIDAILAHIDIPPGARVLDIGCGDATLLCRVGAGAARTGTVLTDQERQKLAAEPALANITFATASFETIDRLRGPFDRIIANGCLHFVRTAMGAERAFARLAAQLAPGGRLWAGELHETDCRRRIFTSKIEAVRYVRARHGRNFALAFARHLWRHRRRSQTIVEQPPGDWWHVRPDAIGPLAQRHGLQLVGTWRCLDLTGDTFYAMQDRFSCLLAKP